jgi:hypothetical protein
VLVLLACARPDPAADRAAFVALDCAVVQDVRLADECRVFAVDADPSREDTLCPEVRDPKWRDECRFIAVDARELTGDDAARACSAAGRFTAACHANAISREVSDLPPMDEARLTAEVQRILATYRRPPREAADIVRRRLATTSGQEPPPVK